MNDNLKPVAIGFRLPAGTVKILDILADELSCSRSTLCKTLVIKSLLDNVVSAGSGVCLSDMADLLRSGDFSLSFDSNGFLKVSKVSSALSSVSAPQ